MYTNTYTYLVKKLIFELRSLDMIMFNEAVKNFPKIVVEFEQV